MKNATGIQISSVAVYHPETIRDNEYYINYYGKKGFLAKSLMEDVFGRSKRYIINPDSGENSISMAIEASKKALTQAHLTGQEVDLICFSSSSPEYLNPPSAQLIHHSIEGKSEAFCFDINASCAGMVFALKLIYSYMEANEHIHTVLLVGSDYFSPLVNPERIENYTCFGDASCAVILQKTTGTSKLIDSDFYVESEKYTYAAAPICGLSNMIHAPKEQLYYHLGDLVFSSKKSADVTKKMLQRNHMKIEDISLVLVSQYTQKIGQEFWDHLGATESQRIYIGDQYGYTGTSSPFISLYEAIQQKRIKRGDYIIIWTVGSAAQYVMLLLKY